MLDKEKSTHPFVNVPATVLRPLGSVRHPLVGPKVPVQVASFLFFSFFCCKESTATCPTTVRSRFVETGY
jgi:hypothetical protein